MQFKKIIYTGGIWIIPVIVCLFLVNSIAQGQCVPGTKGPTENGQEGQYMSMVTNSNVSKVPRSLWPEPVQGSTKNYAVVYFYPTCACIIDCYQSPMSVTDISGSVWHNALPDDIDQASQIAYFSYCYPFACGGGYNYLCSYYLYLVDNDSDTSRDYDCDGIFDSQDPNPGTPDEDANANKGTPSCNGSRGNPTNVATGNK